MLTRMLACQLAGAYTLAAMLFPITRLPGRRLSSTASLTLLVVALAGGCGTPGRDVTNLRPDEAGYVQGLGVESQDLVAVTDKMARALLGLSELTNSTATPRIFTDRVLNETRFKINTDIFLTRIRGELNSKCAGKMRFLARDRMAALQEEREKKRRGEVTSSSDPYAQEFKGGDYLLTGKLQGLNSKTSKGTSDYVLYSFQLIDARTTEIVWEGAHEMKKQGKEDAAYQ